MAGEVVRKGSGQSFGFDSFAGHVLARHFEAGKSGYPLASAFKDMNTFDELVRGRLGSELPSVVNGTMQTYKAVRLFLLLLPASMMPVMMKISSSGGVCRLWPEGTAASTRARWSRCGKSDSACKSCQAVPLPPPQPCPTAKALLTLHLSEPTATPPDDADDEGDG